MCKLRMSLRIFHSMLLLSVCVLFWYFFYLVDFLVFVCSCRFFVLIFSVLCFSEGKKKHKFGYLGRWDELGGDGGERSVPSKYIV